RQQTLENHFLSALEINLEQLEDGQSPSFGAQYNAVFFGVQESPSGETVTFRAGYDRLADAGPAYQFIPDSNATDSANYKIVRDVSGAVIGSSAIEGIDLDL